MTIEKSKKPDSYPSSSSGNAAGYWSELAIIVILCFLIGCTEPLPDGLPDTIADNSACSVCHGSLDNAAPPLSVSGLSSPSDIEVGAHQIHLIGGNIRAALPCESCHIVPLTLDQQGHRDASPAEITWSSLALTGGLSPVWNRLDETCSAVYCHGLTISGGSLKNPVWTKVDGTQTACGTCHGNPPPPPHTTESQCYTCHSGTVTAAGNIDITGNRHIDGVVQSADNSACSDCHGSLDNAAPPLSVSGLSSTSDIEVGAHQIHLTGGNIRAALPCESCHTVPLTVDQIGHRDTSPAEITWSSLAATGGLSPVWNRSDATCSTVYCHGSTIRGGSLKNPVWTKINGTQTACGTCHGNPPPPPHTTESQCYTCHSGTVTAAGDINITGNRHIDGVVQSFQTPHPAGWNEPAIHGDAFYDDPEDCKACHGENLNGGTSGLSCDQCHTGGNAWRTNCLFCHGGLDNASGAPPYGLRGETTVSSPVVGAHTTHLTGSSSHTAWACSTCHTVPASWSDPGHIDSGVGAEIVFSSPAGNNAIYNRTTATCKNLYCHGNGKTVSSNVSWTSSTALTCRSCHGDSTNSGSLSGEHGEHISEGVACSACHKTVVNSANNIINKTTHINGTINVSLTSGTYNSTSRSCSGTNCHGSESWY